MEVVFREASQIDVPRIRQLADEIWNQTYGSILPHGQIKYMLGLMYSDEALAEDLRNGTNYRLTEIDGIPCGFMSISKNPEEDCLVLNRIYLQKKWQGQGIGTSMLSQVERKARAESLSEIHLNVNRKNTRAVSVYRKCGYQITGEQVTDIGHGFVMDDYCMRNLLK